MELFAQQGKLFISPNKAKAKCLQNLWNFLFSPNTSFPRQANLVIGNREELAALFSSMEERDIGGDKVKETRAMKEDKDLEEICTGIAEALFSSPLQKLVVTGGMAPILVVSNDNVSYTEVAIFRGSEFWRTVHCVHLDKIQLHVMTQVSKVEGVVDTTGAGKGLNRLVAK